MRHSRAGLLLSGALLGGCATGSGSDGAEEGDARSAKRARAVELAQRKVAQAELEQQAARTKGDAAIGQAQRELALAENAFAQFQALEAPQRVRKAELDVQGKQNELAETLEEFEQLKLMYAEQDLADQTREMVIHRTERRIEQAKQEVELARTGIERLKQEELAIEGGKLELEAAAKRQALAAAQLDARVAWNGKDVELLEARHALAEAQEAEKEGGR